MALTDTHHSESSADLGVPHLEAQNDIATQLQKGRNPELPPSHPTNALSNLRKFLILISLSFSGFLGQFTAAIIIVAFPPMAADLNASIGDIANCIGFTLLGIAFGPLFWNPLSRVRPFPLS